MAARGNSAKQIFDIELSTSTREYEKCSKQHTSSQDVSDFREYGTRRSSRRVTTSEDNVRQMPEAQVNKDRKLISSPSQNRAQQPAELLKPTRSISPEERDPPTLSSTKGEYDTICAIDVGMTRSCYAYYARKDGIETCHHSDVITSSIRGEVKTPSVVLIEKNASHKAHAFGQEAVDKYDNLSDEKMNQYALFKNPKFSLRPENEASLNSETTMLAEDGVTRMAVVDVLALLMHALKSHFLDVRKQQCGDRRPDPRSVRWILTVPANWTDRAKELMREAAKKAGLWREGRASQLVIVVESEAASIWLREKMSAEGINRFLLVDAGGGTVDISGHELLEDGKLRQLFESDGDTNGSDDINKRFKNELMHIFGTEIIESFARENPGDMSLLIREFERKKHEFRSDTESSSSKISIPASLHQLCQNMDLSKSFRQHCPKRINLEKTSMIISPSGMKDLFKPVVQRIAEQLKKILEKYSGDRSRNIVLVGGFSESSYLHAKLKRLTEMAMFVPERPSLCVVSGAVMFGLNPDVIISRVAKRTYGFKQSKKFDPSIHTNRFAKIETFDGERFCTNLVKVMVKKGDHVPDDFQYTVWCRGISRDQKAVDIQLLTFDDPDVIYCDTCDRDQHAIIRVPVTPDPQNSFQVQICCHFVGTEIRVHVMDRNKRVWCDTHVGFLCY